MVQEKSELLKVWVDHFQRVAESRLGTDQELEEEIRATVEDTYGRVPLECSFHC